MLQSLSVRTVAARPMVARMPARFFAAEAGDASERFRIASGSNPKNAGKLMHTRLMEGKGVTATAVGQAANYKLFKSMIAMRTAMRESDAEHDVGFLVSTVDSDVQNRKDETLRPLRATLVEARLTGPFAAPESPMLMRSTKGTESKSLAGAIAHKLSDGVAVRVMAIGVAATVRAFNALRIASDFSRVNSTGSLVVYPSFEVTGDKPAFEGNDVDEIVAASFDIAVVKEDE